MKQYLRRKFLHWLVKDYFCGLLPEDLLRIEKGGMWFKGKQLTPEQVSAVREDASQFARSAIWRFLSNDAKYQANLTMYNESRDFDGMLLGKAMLLCVETLEQRVKELSTDGKLQ